LCGSFDKRHKLFGGKKAMVLGRCVILATFWVNWMERNKMIFEDAREEELENLWDRVRFWASL
jgi:hypothetical protein